MAAKSFKFVSPGVFLNEVDNSRIAALPGPVGPCVIGTANQGPAMRPVQVNSLDEFHDVFGYGDSYGTMAAEAWLKHGGDTSLTYVRLLGVEHTNKTDPQGKAGWVTNNSYHPVEKDGDKANGGAYGFFLRKKGTADAQLAATFYLQSGSIRLQNTFDGGSDDPTKGAGVVVAADSNTTFTFVVHDEDGNEVDRQEVDFSATSGSNYINNCFNQDPRATNAAIRTNTLNYWLGETFASANAALRSEEYEGFILGMNWKDDAATSSIAVENKRRPMTRARTGWFFSQDMGQASNYNTARMARLFRFHAHDGGTWEQNNCSVAISNIKVGDQFDPYGSFTVTINDEVYTGCNLNPASDDYLAKKVGDKTVRWDDGEDRYEELGNYLNVSKYAYVEMAEEVDAQGVSAELLPFGFEGPDQYKSVSASKLVGSGNIPRSEEEAGQEVTGNVTFPVLKHGGVYNGRNNPSWGYSKPHDNRSYVAALGVVEGDASQFIESSYVFSLDDVKETQDDDKVTVYEYEAGSRRSGTSYTAGNDYTDALDAFGKVGFSSPFWGGATGLKVDEADPFRNTLLEDRNEYNSSAFASLKRAIDSVADPEVVEYNILSMPGVTNVAINQHLIRTCESRGDALGVIDMDGGYVPSTESTDSEKERVKNGRAANVVARAKSIGYNSSYACSYYPWVQVSHRGNLKWAPPSIVALGTMRNSEIMKDVWFAPAGFTRGGLSNGSGGLPVVAVRNKLNSKERDALYEESINPIAAFPAEGIVVYGQKTLQGHQSALDRINVRRLMIYVKKEISRMAATLLFDQNTQATWDRFKNQAEPFLADVKSEYGLEDFRVILDETTTTPDLQDRNTLYAKVLLKPTRSIEYIAVDFFITNTGASFDD